MKNLIQLRRTILFATIGITHVFAQPAIGQTVKKVVTFKFIPGKDLFYILWGGNDAELNRLYSLVDTVRKSPPARCRSI